MSWVAHRWDGDFRAISKPFLRHSLINTPLVNRTRVLEHFFVVLLTLTLTTVSRETGYETGRISSSELDSLTMIIGVLAVVAVFGVAS